ncbi:hypothetical protein [Aporhodopirellula aestuarii]|uniref:Uncharacterized protein n=1 Tax=Aporhodopirellula aestuarii TaxID=2950107 RepID=A0ABT0U575_9BACT|nr:hypothetical protein [Aporhodopirellula aestuarii]MCM2372076.1 hypothetical protein [Aporhodopirellula aestuarii]
MTEQRPICMIFEAGHGTCSWSGKEADGARVTFADGSVNNKFLSWTNLKKLLDFKQKAKEQPSD